MIFFENTVKIGALFIIISIGACVGVPANRFSNENNITEHYARLTLIEIKPWLHVGVRQQ